MRLRPLMGARPRYATWCAALVFGLGGVVGCLGSDLSGQPVLDQAAVDPTPGDTTVTPPPVVAEEWSVVTPVTPPSAPAPRPTDALGGVTDGAAVIVDDAALAGVFLYGIGSNPDTMLASFGETGAGIDPVPAIAEVSGGELIIRAVAWETLVPVDGEDGVIESYPATTLDDGRYRVDFSKPASAIEIALYDRCSYRQTTHRLDGAPAYADGLWTWPVVERFRQSGSCGWGVPDSYGLNVHYLRHVDAGAGFVARARDPDSPFGFFHTPEDKTGATQLSRLPEIAEGAEDGGLVYYLAQWPEEFVGAATAVFEAWNDTLEAEVGVRPFRVEQADEEMIAWDPRHRVVLWDHDGEGGAIAPFAEDPWTGEIFQSLVVMWFGDLDSVVDRYTTFFEERPAVLDELLPEAETAEQAQRPAMWTRFDRLAGRLRAGMLTVRQFIRRPLDLKAVSRIASHVDRDLSTQELGELIVADYLVHEVGHNLGLRHNFSASADHTHTGDGDTATSVMDYVIGMTAPGRYDAAAMRYGYGAGAQEADADYMFCTDEHVDAFPECARWDFGNPAIFWVDALDKLIADNPPGPSNQSMDRRARAEEWDTLMMRLRQLINTPHEVWSADVQTSVFDALIDRVRCGEGCETHTWFRAELSLYLLYTRHVVTEAWVEGTPQVWWDFPALTDTQSALLMDTFFDVITDGEQPYSLKTTVIRKLPSANVDGATALLDRLEAHLAEVETPTDEEEALLAEVQNAQE